MRRWRNSVLRTRSKVLKTYIGMYVIQGMTGGSKTHEKCL